MTSILSKCYRNNEIVRKVVLAKQQKQKHKQKPEWKKNHEKWKFTHFVEDKESAIIYFLTASCNQQPQQQQHLSLSLSLYFYLIAAAHQQQQQQTTVNCLLYAEHCKMPQKLEHAVFSACKYMCTAKR